MLTVTTPAADRGLLSLAELRAATGVTGSGQDADLRTLGQRVAAAITRFCRVPAAGATTPTLRAETLSETFRLSGPVDEIVLARRPVVSIVSVTLAGETLDPTAYESDAGAGLLYRLCGDARTCWPCGKIVVVYEAGFAVVPDDLRLAASKLATALWHEAGRDPNLRSESIPGVLDRQFWVSPASDPLVSQEVQDLLAPHINHFVG